MEADAISVVTWLHEAMNAHDLDAFVACFNPAYHSEQPAHTNHTFGGYTQVCTNWGAMFANVPDLRAELLGSTVAGDTVWSEWAWSGQRHDGSLFDMRGVIIFGIGNDLIAWTRLYMEGTGRNGAGIEQTVQHLTRTLPYS